MFTIHDFFGFWSSYSLWQSTHLNANTHACLAPFIPAVSTHTHTYTPLNEPRQHFDSCRISCMHVQRWHSRLVARVDLTIPHASMFFGAKKCRHLTCFNEMLCLWNAHLHTHARAHTQTQIYHCVANACTHIHRHRHRHTCIVQTLTASLSVTVCNGVRPASSRIRGSARACNKCTATASLLA